MKTPNKEKLTQEHLYTLRMYYNKDFSIHKTMKEHFQVIIGNVTNDKTALSIVQDTE